MSRIILGLTGSFGSGCSYIAEKHLVPKGFKHISLSTFLKDEFRQAKGRDALNRRELQSFGNEIRSSKGLSYLAMRAMQQIDEDNDCELWVIDSIKNEHEVYYLRSKSSAFYLFGIYADAPLRWERVKHKYKHKQDDFMEDDKRDSGEDIKEGQKVRNCFAISDIIILNNNNYNDGSKDYERMDTKIGSYLNLIRSQPSEIRPSPTEAMMAIAYATGFRSSCPKRKVGAVIVDEYNNIISSGYNDVPIGEDPCKQAHGDCYRKLFKDSLISKINNVVPDIEQQKAITEVMSSVKNLERCRALHAEENAIMNLVRFGTTVDLKKATLYTTTYPCNLCANKIAQVGIGKVVYLEPYPQDEAKALLNNRNVSQQPFEGVSYKGYFKLFGGDAID